MKYFSFLALCMSLLVLTGCGNSSSSDTPLACIDATCYDLEIADKPSEHQKGLMNRAELGTGSGMLFVFENPGYHEFWMKNTLIPLDIIWMSEEGTVQYIKEYAPPCKNEPCQLFGPASGVDSKYVLEINANEARINGISPGVKIDLVGVGEE